MSDLISRLSELRCQYNCFDENERDTYHTLSEAIKALSDVPDTNVGDTISRQAMFEVPYGQDPYSAIGRYIRENITVIEDIIAVIDIDGVETNELFMVDMNEDGFFVWKSDWYEGEKKVVLIDFFPVSEATNSSVQPEWQKGHWISCSERMPENGEDVLIWLKKKDPCGKNLRIAKLGLHSIENEFFKYLGDKLVWYSHIYYYDIEDVAAWIPLPEPYKMDGEQNG